MLGGHAVAAALPGGQKWFSGHCRHPRSAVLLHGETQKEPAGHDAEHGRHTVLLLPPHSACTNSPAAHALQFAHVGVVVAVQEPARY